jgi:hypothetical protein
MSFFRDTIEPALRQREDQANRALRLLAYDPFRMMYAMFSFFSIDEVEDMLKFQEDRKSNRVHFTMASGMLVAAGFDIQNHYVPETKGGHLFAVKDGKRHKLPLDITNDTVNGDKLLHILEGK